MVRQWCASKGKGVVTPSKSKTLSSPPSSFDLLVDSALTFCLIEWNLVVIVSYEKLRLLVDELGQTEIGLLLADEGHRLKNSSKFRTLFLFRVYSKLLTMNIIDNQTYKAINEINCKRRVILTGTPIQVWFSSPTSFLRLFTDTDFISDF